MKRRWPWIAAVSLAVLVGAAVGLDQLLLGVPGFYLWRMVSGRFHGGHTVRVNGVSLYYETYGQGPPVVVLHGALGALEANHYFISALALSHTVIAVDSRAQGRSTDSAAPLGFALMADDTLGLLDALHIGRADLVGWSDGGVIGLDIASRHPERIGRLIAIGANYDVNGIAAKDENPRVFQQVAAVVKPFYDFVAPDPDHFPVMVRKVATMEATQPHYTLADLARIRAPTLIIAGENDIILRRHTDALAAAIPGAREVIVPGANHMGPVQMPGAYADLVANFLAGR